MALASTSSSLFSTAAGTRALLVIEYAFERTRKANASGNSRRDFTSPAISAHSTARPPADTTTIRRRPPRLRSRAGPSSGATTANGAMVGARYSAPRPLAAVGEIEKNSEPARAIVRRVSPATDSAWVTASRENGDARNAASTGRSRFRSGVHPASLATNRVYGPTQADRRAGRNNCMADLSDLLGDVYGGVAPASPDDDPVVHEPPASRRAPAVPEWAGDDRLDEVFADWTPGPGPDAHRSQRSVVTVGEPQVTAAPLDDDLAEALSAALAADPLEVQPEPQPQSQPQPAAIVDAPASPSAGALFGGIGSVTTVDTIAVDVAADEPAAELAVARPWRREDDDI